MEIENQIEKNEKTRYNEKMPKSIKRQKIAPAAFFDKARARSAFSILAIVLSALFEPLLFSCQSAKKEAPQNLRLLFAGDIMAHTQNFSMADFNLIWDDIREQVSEADFSFANLEAPVFADRPFESYPTFNMQPSNPAAAFDAGFNLISLANNHTNDQGSPGIKATNEWSKEVEMKPQNRVQKQSAKSKDTPRARPVFFSGLTENGQFSLSEFYWNEYKILFVAVTELLNTWKNYDEINFVSPTKKGRAAFAKQVADWKEERSPDLFIVSVHTSEEEYVLTVRPEVQAFYHALLDAGADIVVSNHPHVVRPIEFIAEKDSKKIRKVIMYANGNTISGQRRSLNYDDPNEIWNYTGDGQIVELEMALDEKGFFALNCKTTFITAYTPQGERSPVIKRLDENFIHSLRENGEKKDSDYFEARLNALKKIKEIWTWR